MAGKLAEAKSIVRKRILGISEVSSISYDKEEEKIIVTAISEEAAKKVRDILPEVIAGYDVVVEVMPKQELLYPRKAKRRPVEGGISIAHYLLTAGTSVTGLTDGEGNPAILSNAHVGTPILVTGDYGSKGDRWEQPGPADQRFGGEDFKCGELYRWAETQDGMTYSDASIARATVGVTNYILGDGEPEKWEITEAAEAEKGLRVKKSGRTTGVTYGEIIGTHADIKAQDHEGNVLWTALDQVVCDLHSEPGDSGSIIVTERDEKAVVLLWGGGGGKSSGTPIGYVMQDLDCGFGTPPHVPPEEHPPITPPPPEGPDYKLLGGVGMVGLAAVSIFNAGATGRDPFEW